MFQRHLGGCVPCCDWGLLSVNINLFLLADHLVGSFITLIIFFIFLSTLMEDYRNLHICLFSPSGFCFTCFAAWMFAVHTSSVTISYWDAHFCHYVMSPQSCAFLSSDVTTCFSNSHSWSVLIAGMLSFYICFPPMFLFCSTSHEFLTSNTQLNHAF